MSIVQLTSGTEITRQAVTKHLRVLADVGLVRDVKVGRERLWEFESTQLDEARRSLELIAEQWDRALSQIEGRRRTLTRPRGLEPNVVRQALQESIDGLEVVERRNEACGLLRAEHEATRRLAEAQDQAARTAERLAELQRAHDGLRRSEAQSQHRAEQIGLLSSVIHRIAPLLDSERLLQEAAETIQSRMSHTYVAVVVLDHEGIVVGRWAGRQGVDRRGAGRTQGPAGGVIGRALRKRAPQVVADVAQDADYHPDVEGTRSEMVIPILEGGEVVGAIDFQSEIPAAFDLDDVAVGETLAEFLVVALRNARRLFAEARDRTV